ncbi:S41 family peptidase [Tenacibaculum xiamenense]|uniref:S41 family peptidase n=1 Tax=Tenacibaculum xiamenense TaxID=1261553 RepID=UPI003892F5E1
MKFYKLLLFFIILFGFISCSSKDEAPSEIEINDFVWKGLNAYYLWQGNISDLSDRRFTSDQQLYSYLSGFNDPNTLFESLLYQRGTTDKWSWIVDDYVALEQSFQGTTQTTGMEFGVVKYRSQAENVFGYVRYVIPGTDAADKGITRGMIFNEVNGTQLTESNYRSLLFSSDSSFTITIADYSTGNPTPTATTITLTKSSYTENPVHIAKTLDINGQKIGYLMYNGFTSNFDAQLNQAFAQFKSDGATELVVDLRYNGGGSVRTATRLGSMITGQFTNEVFAKQLWNEKYMSVANPESLIDRFPNTIENNVAINSLNLTKIYFITTKSSASASELIINSLTPYIDTKTVGTTTHGKYAGSITLYDSPSFYSKNNINPNHNWAMQPIVLEIVNKDGQNQKDGIPPTVELDEDYGNLGVLGEANEPLLERTIQLITTGSRASSNLPFKLEVIDNSKSNTPTYNNMYVTLHRN